MRWVVVAVLLAGCATRTIVVAPGMVSGHAAELKRDGKATIYTMGSRADIHAKDKVEVYVDDGGVQRRQRATLGELAAGCEDAASPSCIAQRVVDQRVTVRHEHHVDEDRIAKAVGFLAVGGLIGYCLAECQDESTVPRALGITAAAVGAAGLLLLLMANIGH
jgi:hypothetical protein